MLDYSRQCYKTLPVKPLTEAKCRIINYLKRIDDAKHFSPDTRIKLRIYHSDSTIDTVCIGQFCVLKNKELFHFSDELKVLLNSMLYAEK